MIHADAQLLLAAGAALDDLEPDERAAYDAHRRGCAECAVLEDELSVVLADLSLLAPEMAPPPDLFAGIRLAIDAERARGGQPLPLPGSAGAATSAVDAPHPIAFAQPPAPAPAPARSGVVVPFAPRPSRRPVYASLGLAAVFGIAAVGLGVRTAGLDDDLRQSQAQVAVLQAQVGTQSGAMAAAMNPSHVTVPLEAEDLAQGANAMVVFVPGTSSSYLVAENLPATPSGHGYQLWYADAAGVHPLQTVPYDGTGAFVAPLDVDLAASSAVMLTLEESGGAQGEPGPQVVFGEL